MVKLYLVNLVIPACVLNGFLHLDGLFWTQLLFLLNLEVYLLLLQKKFKKSFKKVQKKKKERKKEKEKSTFSYLRRLPPHHCPSHHRSHQSHFLWHFLIPLYCQPLYHFAEELVNLLQFDEKKLSTFLHFPNIYLVQIAIAYISNH